MRPNTPYKGSPPDDAGMRPEPLQTEPPHRMEKIYRDADVSLAPLEGKTVAVIGYGIQGKAQAANMRDSGVRVIIGTRPPEESRSRSEAEQDGFEAMSI